jgi:hypothetical protein
MATAMRGRDPETPEEWQDAVDAAAASLVLNRLLEFGLGEGGPAVDVGRCDEILDRGSERGVHPSPDFWEAFVEGLPVAQCDR